MTRKVPFGGDLMYNHEPYEHHRHHRHVDAGSEQAHSKLHSEAMQNFSHKEKREHGEAEAVRSKRDRDREFHSQATKSAFSQHGYWSTQEGKYNSEGLMIVLKGDTLESIAKKALVLRGASTDGPDAIPDEADRIRALNMKRPNMAYLEHSRRIEPGMILDITEPRIGPDIHTAWKPWKDAPADAVTCVHRGERVVTEPGAKVIVEPGAAALVTGGAGGFGYKGSYIESLPGAVTISAGEVSAAHGSNVIKLARSEQVAELTPAQLKNPQIFPR